MKRATNRGNFIIENGQLIGFSTGFDFAAEHEFGIKSLQQAAGITTLDKLKPKKKLVILMLMINAQLFELLQ